MYCKASQNLPTKIKLQLYTLQRIKKKLVYIPIM